MNETLECPLCHMPLDPINATETLVGDRYVQCHSICAEFFESSRPPASDRMCRIIANIVEKDPEE